MRTALAAAAVVLAFLGCGSAAGGGPCSGDVYRCDGSAAVLECRAGRWVSIPCDGPQGCRNVFNGITCDISGNQAGDGCPTAMEGTGFCRGTAPVSLFACRAQQVVKVQDCASCTINSNSITCNP